VVDADLRTVEVHTAQGLTIIPEDGTLDGGAVLPGFTLPVKDIFPAPPSE
jgi:pantothenate kinase type III